MIMGRNWMTSQTYSMIIALARPEEHLRLTQNQWLDPNVITNLLNDHWPNLNDITNLFDDHYSLARPKLHLKLTLSSLGESE
jgi:hypothetical protein